MREDGSGLGAVSDYFGNVAASVMGTQLVWSATRVSGYGPVAGYAAPLLGGEGYVSQVSVWRTRRVDPTGLYWLGARYYEPGSGRFLSADPFGHEASMSLYDYANGDPVNYLDPDGRLAKQAAQKYGEAWQMQGAFMAGAWEGAKGMGHAIAHPIDTVANAGYAAGLSYEANYDFYGGSSLYAINQTFNPAAKAGIAFGEAFGGMGLRYNNSGMELDGWDRTSAFVEGVGHSAETVAFAAGGAQLGAPLFESSMAASGRGILGWVQAGGVVDASLGSVYSEIAGSTAFQANLSTYNSVARILGQQQAASVAQIQTALATETTFARVSNFRAGLFVPGEHSAPTSFYMQGSPTGIYGARVARHEMVHLGAALNGQQNTILHEIAVQFATTPENLIGAGVGLGISLSLGAR